MTTAEPTATDHSGTVQCWRVSIVLFNVSFVGSGDELFVNKPKIANTTNNINTPWALFASEVMPLLAIKNGLFSKWCFDAVLFVMD